jgi:uncharacterized protein
MRRCCLVLACLLVLASGSARGMDLTRVAGQTVIRPTVKTLMDLRFENIERQKYDISCGAAALATLLRYTFGIPTSEQEIIESIFESGDTETQQKIMQLGFSMLELKEIGESYGLVGGGFKVNDVKDLQALKVPALALITVRGYKHFVVVQGLSGGQVYFADPAFGNRSRPIDQFADMWNGVILVLIDKEGKVVDRAGTLRGTPRARAADVVPILNHGFRPVARPANEF